MEIVYWVILIVWIIFIKVSKRDSGMTLKIAFSLFVISAVLTVVNLRDLAEPIMRVSFIGWLIGIFQAVLEYKKANK